MGVKLPAELSDHYLVQYILGNLISQVVDCPLVKQDNIDKMSKYPFFTFKWIDPGKESTTDWLGEHRQYICTMQIDAHAESSLQAMKLAKKIYEALHTDGYRRFFKQAKIIPLNITNASDRTTLSGINYDNDFGFDCSFSVISGFVYQQADLNFEYEDLDIKSVSATDLVKLADGTVSNKSKED